MSKNTLSIILMLVGGAGSLFVSFMSIAESRADDAVTAIPITMVFCTLFICGFFSKNNK